MDVATERGSFIPPEHRFYAGGPSDVRGFHRNELGPVVYVVETFTVIDDVGKRELWFQTEQQLEIA